MDSSILSHRGANPVPAERCQHYFIQGLNGQPIGCVAIAPMELTGVGAGRICRGISLCSEQDTWDRNEARRKAIKRVRQAAGSQKSGEPIQNDEHDIVKQFYAQSELAEALDADVEQMVYVNKVAFDTEPTDRERGILYHLVKRLGGEPVDP